MHLFYLVYPFNSRSRGSQNYSCHLKVGERAENQEETAGCCTYTAKTLLVHF